MKKGLVLTAIVALVLAACYNEGAESISKTNLTINNMSSYKLFSVEYASVDFGELNSGKDTTKEVTSGTRYVFFSLQIFDEQIHCRTSIAITCDEGKNNEITIFNSTTITTIVNSNTNTLENIVSVLETEFRKPQITVKQNNTVTVNGSEIDFGKIGLISNNSKDIIFTIENTGRLDLSIETVNNNRINLSDNSNGYFSVFSQPPHGIIISPGSATTFTIRFKPNSIGTDFFAVIWIKSNSLKYDNFSIRLKGSCAPYVIGDIGPGEGIIYSISGNRYKEVSPILGDRAYMWEVAVRAASAMAEVLTIGGFRLDLNYPKCYAL